MTERCRCGREPVRRCAGCLRWLCEWCFGHAHTLCTVCADTNDPARAWTALARCRGMEPALFFPSDANHDDVMAVCWGDDTTGPCPVREQCLAYALDNHEHHGVWGGTSERERYRARRRARRDKPAVP